MSWFFIFIIFIVALIIVEMASIVLQATGLRKDTVIFQAISLLTGTGFTTKEAELITQHPIRRKVASFLILFGSIAFALLIALMTNIINAEFNLSQSIFGLLAFAMIFLVSRLRWVKRKMVNTIQRNMKGITTLQDVFHLQNEDIVTKIHLTDCHQHLFTSLRELNLGEKYDVYVLSIKRVDQEKNNQYTEWIKYPTGSNHLQKGDEILIMGKWDVVQKIFMQKKD